MPFDAQYEEKGNAMNWKRTARWSWLILPFLLLALWPGVAAAQLGVRPDANALLYEVTENMKIKGEHMSRRVATAALVGTVQAGTPICPALLAGAFGATSCSITAIASDNINLATGKGPVVGTFAVVIQGDNAVDGAELVIVRGTLHGKIDLAPAVLGGDGIPGSGDEAPLGSINARWSARGVRDLPSEVPPTLQALIAGIRARGTLEGTFRLPVGDMANAFYVGESGFVPVLDNERSLAVPTVRLEIEFTAQ